MTILLAATERQEGVTACGVAAAPLDGRREAKKIVCCRPYQNWPRYALQVCQTNSPRCTAAMKSTQAVRENASTGPYGSFESRTAAPADVKRASTHSVVLAPLYEDLNQPSAGIAEDPVHITSPQGRVR